MARWRQSGRRRRRRGSSERRDSSERSHRKLPSARAIRRSGRRCARGDRAAPLVSGGYLPRYSGTKSRGRGTGPVQRPEHQGQRVAAPRRAPARAGPRLGVLQLFLGGRRPRLLRHCELGAAGRPPAELRSRPEAHLSSGGSPRLQLDRRSPWVRPCVHGRRDRSQQVCGVRTLQGCARTLAGRPPRGGTQVPREAPWRGSWSVSSRGAAQPRPSEAMSLRQHRLAFPPASLSVREP